MDAYFVKPEQVKNINRERVVTPKNEWYRPALYVVIDTFNDYILGYAWGDVVTKELIKEAFRNAQRHVQKMTGDTYCWQQLQTDRWGISGKNTTELEQFYTSMATFTPAALKNAQSKYVERSFGTTWHQMLKACFLNNYSGFNVGSKEQINREALDPKQFPDISEAEQMIEAFIWSMRMTTRSGSVLTRHEEWLEAFNASDKSKKKLMTPEQRLQVFGKLHSHTNQIKSRGLTPILNGEQRVYELSQEQLFKHEGKRVQIYYDEEDLSQILVTDSKGLRFIAEDYQTVPAAFADYEEGDAQRIKELQEEKRTLIPMIQEATEHRDLVLERAKIDAESLIQGGVLKKELAHYAQRVITAKDIKTIGVDAENATKQTVKKPVKSSKKDLYDEY